MALDNDPRATRHMNIRREDGSWNPLPMILGVVVFVLLAYWAFGNSFNNTSHTTTPRADAPVATPVNPTTPRSQ